MKKIIGMFLCLLILGTIIPYAAMASVIQKEVTENDINFIRINSPPTVPTITGTSSGKVGVEYDFKFYSIDPNDDDVYYCVNWDCCDSREIIFYGPYESGVEVTLSHSWSEKGNYVIQAYTKDIKEAESDIVTLEISMSRNRVINTPFQWFLQNHLNLFSILQKLL